MSWKRLPLGVVFAVAVLAAGLLPSVSAAQVKDSFDIINFDPTVDGINYFSVSSARALAKKEFAIGVHADFSRNPLQQQSLTTGVIAPQTANLLVFNLLWAYGITDWLGFGFNVPVVPVQSYTALGSSSGQENKSWLGDVRLESKLRLLDVDEYRFGIAVIPFATIPTGESEITQPSGAVVNNYLGNGSATGGGKVVLEAWPVDPLVLALNIGYTFHKDVNPGGLSFNMDDVITYGLGLNARLNDWLHFISEVNGFTVAKSFFKDQYSSPIEAGVGFKVNVPGTSGKLLASLGTNFGLNSGYGTPDWRGHGGISYALGGREEKRIAADVQPEDVLYAFLQDDRIAITEQILFGPDGRSIHSSSEKVLDDVIDLLEENPHIRLMRIEGYMDSMSSEEESLKTSRFRANLVRDYLIIRGIDPERLVAVGYGSLRPIADNATEAGRAQNRRVEFTIISRSRR